MSAAMALDAASRLLARLGCRCGEDIQLAQLLDGMNKAAERDGFGEDGPMAPTLQALRLCMLALREMAASVLRIT